MVRMCFCLIILVLLVCSVSYAYDKGDFQIWHTDYENINIHKNVKFSMEQEYRFGENATEFYYQHYEWGFVYGFHKMLDLGFFYRLVLERYKKKWREEDMPNLNATLKFDLWKFKFDDRNRLEFRHFRYRDDFIRYRNKFTVKLPVDFAKQKIKVSPYLSDEIFIVSNGGGFNENRFSSGLEFELTKYAKCDIYYLLKSNWVTGDKWTDANVLGTKIKIAF